MLAHPSADPGSPHGTRPAGTDPEAPLRRLARLAAHLFGVPFVLITGPGDPRPAATHGLDASEVEDGAWTRAAEAGEALIVEDARADARFVDHPLVTGPRAVRFIVGLRLPVSGGRPGALYLMDRRPRSFETDEAERLHDLAALVAQEVERRQVSLPPREPACTEQKHAEDALRASEARYRLLAENVADMLMLHAPDGLIRFASPACRRLLGFEPEELVGTSALDLVHPEDRPQTLRARAAVLNGAGPQITYRLRRKDGTLVWAEAHGRGIVDPATGTVTEILTVTRDVTERKRAEAALLEAKQKAEEIARLKSAFLTNMSHEIRTPLTGILGFTELLADSTRGEDRDYVRYIQKNGYRLLDTLNAVLDLAQLESRTRELYPMSVDVGQVAAAALHRLRREATERGLDLRLERPEHPVRAHLDPDALDRVLAILTANAIKFTDDGSVTVAVDETPGQVTIRVTDTGIGISTAFLPHLFEAFQQESLGIERSYEGCGLGLPLVHQLVELMHGAVTVTSQKGQGSTFLVTFPKQPLEPPTSTDAATCAAGFSGAWGPRAGRPAALPAATPPPRPGFGTVETRG